MRAPLRPRSRRPPPRFALLLVLAIPTVLPLQAKQTGEYTFEILPDGTPRFTQVLRWDADPNVLYYELTLQTASGQDILVSRLEAPTLSLNLGPGVYRYKIALYNLLRQREVELPWCTFTVLKAEIPRITAVRPTRWFLEDLPETLTIAGERLVPGATIAIRREKQDAPAIAVVEREREGTTAVSVAYPANLVTAGQYAVEITNPGGLSTTFRRAFLVRHMLPAPALLEPPPGTTYGPDELRGMVCIQFGWEAVPEATRYDFCLYRDGDADPVVRMNTMADPSCTLEDLTLLDRGEYRWTVEATAREGETVVIPAAAVAESRFRIELPQLAAPSLDTGDVYYGR